jgi:hypothetical protein
MSDVARRSERLHYRLSLADKVWLSETAQKQDRTVSDILDEALRNYREAIDAAASSPAEVQRKRVLRELRDTNEKLEALIGDGQDGRKMGKVRKEGSREARLAEIAFLLGNLDEKKGPLGAYATLKGNWDLIRFQAAKDLKDEPEWAAPLKVTESEVDEACDLAQEIDKLIQTRQELRSENRVLRGRVANPDELEEQPGPINPEPSSTETERRGPVLTQAPELEHPPDESKDG